ncbi:MAG TPA: M28 family peptidase, partial [Thermoanaerobaculia bacterium]|nr:M28 family peptidase [Thermoanaerobaculia bacterium]
GRPILFQTGPGNAWLARAWSASVPYPYGTVIGQDVFQSGVIPSDTDFRVFRDDGRLTGIDYALVRDGWKYHTRLDTVNAIAPGSLQEMGSNVLALLRSLANRSALPRSSSESAVYYDLAGLAMVAYPESLARLLAIGLIAIAVGAWIAATVRRKTRIGATLAGLLVAIVAFALPLAAAAGAGLAGPALGRAHRWYAVAGPALGAWVAAALVGVLIAASIGSLLLRGSDLRRRQGAIAAGSALLWAVVVALGSAAGIGSTYLAVWWLAAACVTALSAAFVPRATTAVAFLALLPPLVLTLQLSRLLVDVFVPISGRMLSSIPFDPILAVLAALPVVLSAPQAAVWLQGVGGKTFAGALLLGFAVVSLAISLGQFPYSPSKPQRVDVRHVEGPAITWIEFELLDDPGARSPHRDLFGGLKPERIGEATFALPAARREIALPIQSAVVPEGANRKLLLDLGPGPWHEAVLELPEGRVEGWTVWTERGSFAGKERRLRLVNLPATVAVTIRGASPAIATLEVRSAVKTPELVETLRRMPDWTAPDGTVVVRRRIGM